MRGSVLLITLLAGSTAQAQRALGSQLGASPTFSSVEVHPAPGLLAIRSLNTRWHLFAEVCIHAPKQSSFSGIVEPRRQLAFGTSDTTIRSVRSS